MSLPAIDIPLHLPFELPLLLHPPFVHFAIALPILILIVDAINLFTKKRAIAVASFGFMFLMILLFFAAFFAGKTDGSEIYATLSAEGKEELSNHKLLGTYLVYASLIILALKSMAVFIRKIGFRIFYLVMMLLFCAGTLYQGYEGGELVYEYGANVKKVAELDDKLFDTEEAVYDAKAALETCQTELETLKNKAAAAVSQPEAEATVEAVEETVHEKAAAAAEAVEETVEGATEAVGKALNEANETVAPALH